MYPTTIWYDFGIKRMRNTRTIWMALQESKREESVQMMSSCFSKTYILLRHTLSTHFRYRPVMVFADTSVATPKLIILFHKALQNESQITNVKSKDMHSQSDLLGSQLVI